jgi:hypothetical protein
MQIIKKQIKFNSKDENIIFNLKNNIERVDFQENIDNLLENEVVDNINSPDDNDVIKITRRDILLDSFTFNFYDGYNYIKSLQPVGITNDDITNKTPVIYKSFYMIEYFTTMNTNTQEKLYTGYLPVNLLTNYSLSTIYGKLLDKEFSNIYLKKSYLNENSENHYVYCRFSFYNSTTGDFRVFYNGDKRDNETDEREYFRLVVYPDTNEYIYRDGDVICYENVNYDYVNRMNETIESNETLKPNYPNGTIFGDDGKYT